MINRKLHIRFRLTPRSMILDGLELYKFEFAENFAGVRRFGEATTAKRMNIEP